MNIDVSIYNYWPRAIYDVAVNGQYAGGAYMAYHPGGAGGSTVCCVTVTGTRFKKDANTYWYGPQHSGSISLGNCPALATMRTNGTLSETEERILRAMSQNEGKVDTVQAIDVAIISAGAMQKTIRGSASQGELATQIAAFRDAHPAEYQRYFANCGWTVTGSGSDASLGYAHSTFTSGARIIGDELYTALRRDCSISTLASRSTARLSRRWRTLCRHRYTKSCKSRTSSIGLIRLSTRHLAATLIRSRIIFSQRSAVRPCWIRTSTGPVQHQSV
ncbi:hypothetical protein [Paraburkholderia sp. BR10882]|uniref:hypothetical protein n=1 Tax=unclassified Paraburkholderia TaxID=2615204 RepID=UPI0034CE7A90